MSLHQYEPQSELAYSDCNHAVQFYEDDRFLIETVVEFLAAGMLAGQSLVVIATEAHREAMAAGLGAAGHDVDGACFRGRLLFLDAEEALATFMNGGSPDADLFQATVGSVIDKSLRAAGTAGLRAYGEMVDVLWKAGNAEGALQLEDLWNALADRHQFSLLCAYSMGNFYQQSDMAGIQSVCGRHSHVMPAESFVQLQSEDTRNREIARLQQQERALKTEIAERRKLEASLRDVLAKQKALEAELRASEEELRDFLDNAVDGLHWVDAEGRILWANQAELDLLGVERGEYIGSHIARFHADPHVIEDMLSRLRRNEKLIAYPARLRCKDGSLRHVEISSNVRWKDGVFVHTRCFTREVPDR
jgi:PAS domain S-box-containing protein